VATVNEGDVPGRVTSTPVATTPTVVDTIADPAPLGLAAFALTTFVLSCANANIVNTGAGTLTVLGLALAYGGIAQLLAGMWEFRKGNTFGALAFSSYGAFWISFWWLVSFNAGALATSHVLGVWLLAWTIFTAYMCIASTRTNGVVFAVFLVLTLTFFFLMLGAWGGHSGLTKFGGWLGIITAVLAWYGSFAGVTNFTYKKTVLPVFPMSGE
jgi:uncharacterized protein